MPIFPQNYTCHYIIGSFDMSTTTDFYADGLYIRILSQSHTYSFKLPVENIKRNMIDEDSYTQSPFVWNWDIVCCRLESKNENSEKRKCTYCSHAS